MDLSTREGRRQQGERIKRAAAEAGLTLDELARRIGCSHALIYQYASGGSLVQTDRLQQIAAVVDRPLPWFFLDDIDTVEADPWTEAARLQQERARLQAERQELDAERAAFEAHRRRDAIANLQALVAAYSAPADWTKVVGAAQQLLPLHRQEDDVEEMAEALLTQGNARINLSELGPAREALEQARALFQQLEQPARVRDCLQSLGHVNLMLGRIEEAQHQFQQVAAGEDWWNRWQGTLSLGAVHEMQGDYAAAMHAFEAALQIAEERQGADETENARLYIEANWANLALDYGDYAAALQKAEWCLRAAFRRGRQDQYLEAQLTRGLACLESGEKHTAFVSVQQARDMAQLNRDTHRWSQALACLSLCKTACRQPAEAIADGKEALALALRCGASRAEMLAQRALCEAYLAFGNTGEAQYHGEQGLNLAVANRLRHAQAQFGVLRAQVALAAGEMPRAVEAARHALQIAEALEARPIQWPCHLVLARAALAAGDVAEAGEHARAGLALSQSMQVEEGEWPCYALLAQIANRQDDREGERQALEQALAGFDRTRQEIRKTTGEDRALEEGAALELWREWLQFQIASAGPEAALAAAEAAQWPPLSEWLLGLLSQDGTPHA